MELQDNPDDMALTDMDYTFHDRLRRTRTPVTTAFFSLDNLIYISNRVSHEVGQRLSLHHIIIQPTVDYFQYLADFADSCANRTDVYQTICAMDAQVVDHEVVVHYNSLRRRGVFFKWFVYNNRPLVMDHPVMTYGRHRPNPINNGMYAVNGPDGHSFSAFRNYMQDLKHNHIRQPDLFNF
jgi:hypothetical protein